MVVKQLVMEWQQQAQNVVPDVALFAAMQLSFDLHFLEASLQPYTTPAGVRMLHTCHSLLAQVISHHLCDDKQQCRQVQQAYGSHASSQSVAAWLSQLGQQAVEQASSSSSFMTDCLQEGAALGQAAMSAPAPSVLSRLASVSSGLAPYDTSDDVPASPRRRLIANKPALSLQSRLIGKSASSAAALVALQGKYAMPSSPRSPTIKAFHHIPTQQSIMHALGGMGHQTNSHQGAELAASLQLQSKPSRLYTAGSSNAGGLRSDSRTGSILGSKERHSRSRPPVLQPQSSISLNAIVAIRRPPPIKIALQT